MGEWEVGEKGVIGGGASSAIIDALLSALSCMPKKIRELKSLLLNAGFIWEPGKGSHTKWSHPLLPGKLTLSGKDGADAKPYQEKDVDTALQRLAELHDKGDAE